MSEKLSEKLQFKLDFDQDIKAYLATKHPEIMDFRILSKSLDARGAPRGKKPVYHYTIEGIKVGGNFENEAESFTEKEQFTKKPIIVGAGPAGLFAALRFEEYGIKSIVIERGAKATNRMLFISKYWRRGTLNTESNVCYGEGGAGLFSDGKLITRVKSPFIKYVMNKFVEFGAPEEVAYISNPHLGSNKIRNIITKVSDYLKEREHKFYYDQRVEELLFEDDKVIGVILDDGSKLYSDHVILGTGHSAKEMYYHLRDNKVGMKQKDFAVGVRIEHSRAVIDKVQHGKFHESEHLGAARYRLSHHNNKTEKGTYSFCMCPGGYVLSSGTDSDGIVVNGMSNYARNSRWSNSALVVSIKSGDDFSEDNILAGLDFQNMIEQNAYKLSVEKASGRELPAITLGEFISGKMNSKELPKNSVPSGLFKADFSKIFPEFILSHLREALKEFDRKMEGYVNEDALLIAPETRTSAPVTILRDKKTLESTTHKGLYPCGEGAGYAGGITSAAVDGVRVVESIINN